MSKLLFLTTFLVSVNLVFAESLPRDYWYVQSDKVESNVKQNTCLVTGTVSSVYSESPVSGGIISNLDRSSNTTTNENGEFTLLLSSKDTAIFFYHPEYSEIVCWKYNFQSGHHVVMNFITSEKLADGMMIMEEKPVVYLYSQKDLKVNLTYSNYNDFTFTYPEYKPEGWNVHIEQNQLIVNGEHYPYLFWEGMANNLDFKRDEIGVSASYINTDTTISYLENSLSQLGFNSKEKTDFITYWGPRIQEFPFAQIQFLVDENYDTIIGKVETTVDLDASKRIYMVFQGSESNIQPPYLLKQEFKGFERKGFTLVEWGGSELEPMTGS